MLSCHVEIAVYIEKHKKVILIDPVIVNVLTARIVSLSEDLGNLIFKAVTITN